MHFQYQRKYLLKKLIFLSATLIFRKLNPKHVFVCKNIPLELIRICKIDEELNEFDLDSNDIDKHNMTELYKARLKADFKGDQCEFVASISLANFVSYDYNQKNTLSENNFRPETLSNDIFEASHTVPPVPYVVPLSSNKEYLKCRKLGK